LPDVDDWKWSEEMINEVKDKVQAWKGILWRTKKRWLLTKL
jgi:hypothetical protein